MARKRRPLSVEDLIAITEHSTKRFVCYDEGRILYSMGRNRFIELSSIDYVALLDKMIRESKEMTGDFVLADLPTYSSIEGMLIETDAKISAASVKARLGKIV